MRKILAVIGAAMMAAGFFTLPAQASGCKPVITYASKVTRTADSAYYHQGAMFRPGYTLHRHARFQVLPYHG